MWHWPQKNLAIRAIFGRFRIYVPCEVTGPRQTGHDDNLAFAHCSPVTYSSKVSAVAWRSCTSSGPRRVLPSRTFPFAPSIVGHDEESGKVLGDRLSLYDPLAFTIDCSRDRDGRARGSRTNVSANNRLLDSLGWHVLRVTDHEVWHDLDTVVARIITAAQQRVR